MCDFKVGDEVVCVDDRLVIDKHLAPISPLKKGAIYTVVEVGFRDLIDSVVVFLKEQKNDNCGKDVGYRSSRFRKVQRRNSRLTLEAFFTVPGGFEEPKRSPAKKRERV